MTIAVKPMVCAVCGGTIENAGGACPNCRAIPHWQDYVQAVDFARTEITGWQSRGLIGAEQQQQMDQRMQTARTAAVAAVHEGRPFASEIQLAAPGACWRCGRAVGKAYAFCNTCGAPLGEAADALRYLDFLRLEIKAAESCLSPAELSDCDGDIQIHISALQTELEQGRLGAEALRLARLSHLRERKIEAADSTETESQITEDAVEAIKAAKSPEGAAARSRRSLLEIILDPRSIQWLLGSGGVLLMVGLVIWLASLGVFKNALVVAGCMGAGTLGVLGSGIASVKLTRHQLAGRALTLLACLVMPLNLWFYHRHALVTLDGHLWVAALVCCVFYAIAAAVLEDPLFVYVLAAGVATTGLLTLADLHKLHQVASPCAWMMALGFVFLHVERAFVEGDGPFSRKRFGMACFWSAQVLIGSGLVLLLGAQLVGFVPKAASWFANPQMMVTDPNQRLLAIALVIAGAYSYLYAGLVIRKVGIYLYVAAFSLLWAGLLLIDQVHMIAHPPVLMVTLAVTALGVNLMQALVSSRPSLKESVKLTRPLAALGLLLASAPVIMGVLLHLRTSQLDLFKAWPYTATWPYTIAMLAVAICCRFSVYLSGRRMPRLIGAYWCATAAATLVAAAASLPLLGVKFWPAQSSLLMLIPVAYMIASRLYQTGLTRQWLFRVAHASAAVLLISVIGSAFNMVPHVEAVVGAHLNIQLAVFWLEAAAFYIAAAVLSGAGVPVYLAVTLLCSAIWQLLSYWNIPGEFNSISFAAAGMILLLALRIGARDRSAQSKVVLAIFRCGNALMSLSVVATALLAMSRLAVGHADWTQAILLAGFALLAVIAAGVVRHRALRQWYLTAAVFLSLLTFVFLQKLSQMSGLQKLEMGCVSVGILLLGAGYTLRYREHTGHSDGASFCLIVGSVLAGTPLLIAAIVNRFGFEISLMDELGLMTVSILLFVTGFLFRLRAPTLIGGALLTLHLSMLLIFAGMRAQLALGIYLSAGGAVLFAVGLCLSIYRDRLLALPRKIKDHQGVFSVLAWR